MQSHLGFLCGQTLPSPVPTSLIMEEIALLAKQTRHIDQAMSALNVTRVKSLRRLNDLRSPTNKLPPEILSTIFTHVSNFTTRGWRSHESEIHPQITLGSVSSYWRQATCSTPKLWATALIKVGPKTVGFKTELLQLYFKSAKNVPISLRLRVQEPHRYTAEFSPILQAIQDGVQKLIFLGLRTPPETWLPALSPHLQKLEGLHFEGELDDENFYRYDHRGDTLQFSDLSNILSLRRVYLEGCLLRGALPYQPCYSITDLHLLCVTTSSCIQLLMLCPNLISYRCEGPYPDKDLLLPSDTAVFHNMEYFQIPEPTYAPFGELLSILHFPALKTFCIELHRQGPCIENLLAFIRRLPATCSTLEILNYFEDTWTARVIQAVPPQVQSLRLPDSQWNAMLQALCDNNDAGSFNMLGIRHIYVTHLDKGLNTQLFLDMLSARKELLGGYFLLEIDPMCHDNTSWTHLQGRLRALIFDGLRLEIFVSGVLIPCLREIYEELESQ